MIACVGTLRISCLKRRMRDEGGDGWWYAYLLTTSSENERKARRAESNLVRGMRERYVIGRMAHDEFPLRGLVHILHILPSRVAFNRESSK
jgi:hypothetical protein